MPLSDHVSLTITQDSVGVSRAGFGTLLILSATAAWAERTRTYNSLSDVAADFPVTSCFEYRAAAAAFSQNPKPEQIKIGRSALPATLVHTLVPTVLNSTAYTLTLAGKGVTETAVSFTSDASATDAEIVTGLIAAVNAVVGRNFLATGTTSLVITGLAAGDWFSVKIGTVSQWTSSAMTHTDPGVATDLAAITLADDDWYALYTGYNSDAYVKAAAAWIETVKKIYVFDTNELTTITTTIGNSELIDDLHTLAYDRTSGMYHPAPYECAGAAWLGRVLPFDPGSETWKFKTLTGVNPVSLTGTHRVNLRARKANTYETTSGVNITWDGTMVSGEFIDVTRGLDWLDDDMSAAVFGALAGAPKIPYTDPGVAVIESEVRASLKRAADRGIITEDFTVTVPLVADVSAANKLARLLPDIRFSATLAGAIHKTTISGVISV